MKRSFGVVLFAAVLLAGLCHDLFAQQTGDRRISYWNTYPASVPLPPVDPVYKAVVEAPHPPPIPIDKIPEIRVAADEAFAKLPGMHDKVASVENRAIALPGRAIPIRLYYPFGQPPFPIVVFYHGGGFVLGGLNSHDDLCRSLAARASALVVSVSYRLAPENRFPAAVDDSYAALQWVAAHAGEFRGDPSRIAVAGDSAGATLAAVVSLESRDKSGPKIAEQVLIYPATGTAHDTASYFENQEGYGFSREDMEFFEKAYLSKPSDADSPYYAPIKANDLHGLPPAFIVTAQYDILRDDGEAYASRLHWAGVPVRVTRYLGQIHGFILYAGGDATARHALNDIAAALRTRLLKPGSY